MQIIKQESGVEDIELQLLSGPSKGEKIVVEEDMTVQLAVRNFEKGDKVIVVNNIQQDTYYIADYDRTEALFILLIIFIIVVLLVSKLQGLGSMIGMAFSFLVLFKLTLPMILAGTNPVWAAILGAALIIPITFFLSHGMNKKTLIAGAGTLVSLILSGFLASLFINIGNLTGFASEEASFLSLEAASKINFKGLVLAGMIISMLGVMDDITISQTSIVQQLAETKKNIKFRELYSRSMAIGKDHIASMVNTLILVYAGASLPLLLLFVDYSSTFLETVSIEIIAAEIIRTLIGSIGLVLAVPITTLFATIMVLKKNT